MILFLNGCSSAGKSTIARAVQHLSDHPWLCLGVDTFFQMMPSKYVGFGEKAAEGFHFIPAQDEEGSIMHVQNGTFGQAVCQSIPKVVQTLADDNHDLIIDEVLFTRQELQSYATALAGHTVYFIGVMCDLKTLQEREILRNDRALGLGRDQFTRVHAHLCPYDLTVDTTTHSAFGCAQEILSYIHKTAKPLAFKKISEFT